MTSEYEILSEKIQAVLEWADENGWFDTDFIESLDNHLEGIGSLTDNQEQALDNIIDKFNIEV